MSDYASLQTNKLLLWDFVSQIVTEKLVKATCWLAGWLAGSLAGWLAVGWLAGWPIVRLFLGAFLKGVSVACPLLLSVLMSFVRCLSVALGWRVRCMSVARWGVPPLSETTAFPI